MNRQFFVMRLNKDTNIIQARLVFLKTMSGAFTNEFFLRILLTIPISM